MTKRSTFKCILAFAAAAFLFQSNARAQLVTTYAGYPAGGYVNDTGTAAAFNQPITITIDKNKNLYVADAENHRVRKISPAGMVSTFAGSLFGFINDTASGARFFHPLGVVVDDAGFVYVADSKNNAIRKISPAGLVTTLAGATGVAGYKDGAGDTATFNYPNGIALDAAKNVYVADASNNMIRKITPDGVVSTVAGALAAGNADGQGTGARFTYPTGIAVDAAGNLFVADENNHLIRKITAAGAVSTYAGSGSPDNIDDTGSAAAFNAPYGIAIDAANNLYVAEIGNNQIRKITPGRKVMSFAGNGTAGADDGLRTDATFFSPTGITLDGTTTMYVADWKNNLIRKIDLTATGIFTVQHAGNLSLYPNPASDVLHIPAKEGERIAVYNSVGAVVYEGVAKGAVTTVGIKTFPAGMYTVVVFLKDGRRQAGKFVKE